MFQRASIGQPSKTPYTDRTAYYDENRRLLGELLTERLPEVGYRMPEGTYFAASDVSGLGWSDGAEFCQALPERAGVVAIPLQGFYSDPAGPGRHLVRWAFCKQPELIGEALERLSGADLSR